MTESAAFNNAANVFGDDGSPIVKLCEERGIRIVERERNGNHLYIVVEADSVEDAQSAEARALAYDARFESGFSNAGIEILAGSQSVGNNRYQQTWKLTRGI